MAATAALSGHHGLPGRFSSQQAAVLAETARGWLGDDPAAGLTDRETAQAGVCQAYLAAGLGSPERVVWFGAPLSGAVAVAVLTGLDAEAPVRDPLWDRVRAELHAQGTSSVVGRIGRPVRAWIGPLVWNQVRNRVRRQTGPGLWEQVWEQTAGEVLRRHAEPTWHRQIAGMVDQVDAWLGWQASQRVRNQAVTGLPEAAWCATVDGLRRVLPGLAGPERLAGLLQVMRTAGWWWPFQQVAIMTERPVAAHRDQQGRLHRPDGPAVAYGDGSALHAWHGTPVPAELIARLPQLQAADIQAERNLELRRVMTEAYGLERYLRDAGASLVGRDRYGTLWRLDQPGEEPLLMVEVVNATPEPDGSHATYWLRVPPDISSAHAAVAWTFGLNTATYRPSAET
jgi:Domain of unknown function (DUF6745)